MNKLAVFVFFVCAISTAAQPVLADPKRTASEIIDLNNKGVNLLNKNNYDAAIELLTEAVAKDPQYPMARCNLSIALNNKALAIQNTPEEALHCIEKALFLDPENITTQHNADGLIRMLSLDPNSPADRINLGFKALSRNEYDCAFAEFASAIALSKHRAKNEEKNQNSDLDNKKLGKEPDFEKMEMNKIETGDSQDFYKAYMNNLGRDIKKHWFPPRSSDCERVVLRFKIDKNGKADNISVIKCTSGAQVGPAIEAVKNGSPFDRPLSKVDIQFTFSYNVFSGGGMGKPSSRVPSNFKRNGAKIEHMKSKLTKQPNSIQLRIKLARLLVKVDEIDKAIAVLEEGHRLFPDDPDIMIELIQIRYILPIHRHSLPGNVA